MDGSAQVGGFNIEPMRRHDLPEVMAIERCSFLTPWSRNAFEREMEKTYASLRVARLPGRGRVHPVLGYVCLWLVADEVQVTNLAVHPGYRRRGVGGSLLMHACGLGHSAGARLVVLEVGESNKAARALYETAGFVAVQKRPRYYPECGEDALVMSLSLG
jgi:ribosomal-protein-alanine N-acetyltransferase